MFVQEVLKRVGGLTSDVKEHRNRLDSSGAHIIVIIQDNPAGISTKGQSLVSECVQLHPRTSPGTPTPQANLIACPSELFAFSVMSRRLYLTVTRSCQHSDASIWPKLGSPWLSVCN